MDRGFFRDSQRRVSTVRIHVALRPYSLVLQTPRRRTSPMAKSRVNLRRIGAATAPAGGFCLCIGRAGHTSSSNICADLWIKPIAAGF